MDKHTIVVEFPSHQNGYKLIVPMPWDKGYGTAKELAESVLRVLEAYGIRYDTVEVVDFAAAEHAREGGEGEK